MPRLTVDALCRHLWKVFDSLRGELALGDYRDTVFSALALKAAEERERHRGRLTARDLLPSSTSKTSLASARRSTSTWADLLYMSDADLANTIQGRRQIVEEREPSLAGALIGLDAPASAARGPMLQQIVRAVAAIPLDPAAFERPWVLGAALDRTIVQLVHAERLRAEYSTGSGARRLMARIADLGRNLSVHDPAAGTCRLLVECAQALAQLGGDPASLRLSGVEINQSFWSLGRIYLWCCGLDATGVRLGNALKSTSAGSYERVVCDPPFGRMPFDGRAVDLLPEVKKGLVQLEDAFLALSSQLLGNEGRAVVLVPQGTLFRARAAPVRRRLVDQRSLRAVIQLPPGLLFGTSITTALVVIDSRRQDGVVFVDGRTAGWETDTGDIAAADVDRIRTIVEGGVGTLPARVVPYREIIATEFALAPDRFLSGEPAPDVIVVPKESYEGQVPSSEIVLVKEQLAALEEMTAALAQGGVVNLIGARGTGKTTTLRQLRERLSDATVIALGVGTLDRGDLVRRLRDDLSSWQGREGRLVLLLDDWDHAATVINEQETADFQHLLYILTSRGFGSGIVLASERPLSDLEAGWERQILPVSVVGSAIAVVLGAPAQIIEEWWDRQIQTLRNRLLHEPWFDVPEALTELRTSAVWAHLPHADDRHADLAKSLSAYRVAADWERFLRQLATRERWLIDECSALGFHIEAHRGEFGTFLAKTNMSPEDFVGQLLRPTDLRALFPDLEHTGEKSATLRQAFVRWKAHEGGP